jgi:hypothetical protein
MPTGFVDRIKGKGISPASYLGNFGIGGATFRGGGNIYQNMSASTTGIALTSTTSLVVLDTFSLPANSLDIPGRMICIQAFGLMSGNTHTKTITLTFGSETVAVTNATTTLTSWFLEMTVIKAANNSQVINTQQITGTIHGGTGTQTAAEVDTAAITISVSAQTQTANASEIILSGWFIEGMN